MSSSRNKTSALRRVARLLGTIERFVSIDMHPSVYVSFIAINICLVFVYREFSPPPQSKHQTSAVALADDVPGKTKLEENDKLACSLLPGDRGELPSMIQAMVKPISERQKQDSNKDEASETQEEKAPAAGAASIAKSSGAALAAVPERVSKPKKKTKRTGRGLVPPPPPGVLVVPPPPDAPSIYSHLGSSSFLTAVPPPMVLDESYSVVSQSRTHKGSVHNYGKRFGKDRSRTVNNGTCQQVIVSR